MNELERLRLEAQGRYNRAQAAESEASNPIERDNAKAEAGMTDRPPIAAGVGYPQGAPRVTGPAMRPPHPFKKERSAN
jgi:hypothetical protein